MRTPCSSSTSAAASASASRERCGGADAAPVEPAAELPLLASRDGCDASGLTGVALHECERLQDGVVDARGDLGAFLEPDALGALGGELPDPRPDHEHERAENGAGPDEMAGRAVPAEEDDRAGARERDAEHGHGAAGPDRPAAQEDDDQADDEECRAERGGTRQAERDQQHRDGEREEEGGGPGAPSFGEDPEREIGDDARAAREGEQREDEPHERRVHAEAGGEAAADPGEDAILPASLEEEGRHLSQSPALTTSMRPAPTRASITSRPPRAVWTAAFRPSSWRRRT